MLYLIILDPLTIVKIIKIIIIIIIIITTTTIILFYLIQHTVKLLQTEEIMLDTIHTYVSALSGDYIVYTIKIGN